jgi:hypothetical protein
MSTFIEHSTFTATNRRSHLEMSRDKTTGAQHVSKLQTINLVLGIAVIGTACGTEPSTVTGPEHWLGATRHLSAFGTLNGESIELEINGDTAADLESLACERDYLVPLVDGAPKWDEGVLADIQITGVATAGGMQRFFEIELKSHDFGPDAPGTTIEILPRNDEEEPGPLAMWLEWEWIDELGDEIYESAAETGTFTLGAFEGEVDANGLVIPDGEGWIGGFLYARWSETEDVRLSFSVNCGENEVEMVE